MHTFEKKIVLFERCFPANFHLCLGKKKKKKKHVILVVKIQSLLDCGTEGVYAHLSNFSFCANPCSCINVRCW